MVVGFGASSEVVDVLVFTFFLGLCNQQMKQKQAKAYVRIGTEKVSSVFPHPSFRACEDAC